MTTLLKFTGAALYGSFIAYMLWMFFGFLTPRLLDSGWLGGITYLIAGVFIIGLFCGLGTLLSFPLSLLATSKLSRLLPFTVLFISCTGSFLLPWQQESPVNYQQILNALIADSFILGIYGSLFLHLLKVPVNHQHTL